MTVFVLKNELEKEFCLIPKHSVMIKNKKLIKKSEVLIFSAATRNHAVKFLGLVVDGVFSWSEHVTSNASKLGTPIFPVSKIKHVSHAPAKLSYYTRFHSLASYAIIIRDALSEIQKALILQKHRVDYRCLEHSSRCVKAQHHQIRYSICSFPAL